MSGQTAGRYRLDRIDVEQLNDVLRRIQNDMDEALSVGQNPDFKGRPVRNIGKAVKPNDAITKEQFDAHNHSLATLTEKNYASLSGRPDDDDFKSLKLKPDIQDKDSLVVLDRASKTYKKMFAELIIPPSPATTVESETEFEQVSAVGTETKIFALEDHTHGTPTIDRLSNALAADVAMALANTAYDGPTVSLTEGRWLVAGTVTVASDTAAAHSVTAKLWDGTLTYASSEERTEVVAAVKVCCSMSLSAIINVVAASAPLSVKITCLGTGTNAAIKAATVNNGAGNNASMLNAIRIGPSV